MNDNLVVEELKFYLHKKTSGKVLFDSGVDDFAFGASDVEWLQVRVASFAVRVYWTGGDEIRICAIWDWTAAVSEEYFFPSNFTRRPKRTQAVEKLGEIIVDMLTQHHSVEFTKSQVLFPNIDGGYVMDLDKKPS